MVDERYARNIGAISEAEQEKLRRSRVLVAGCGPDDKTADCDLDLGSGMGSATSASLTAVAAVSESNGDTESVRATRTPLRCCTSAIACPCIRTFTS